MTKRFVSHQVSKPFENAHAELSAAIPLDTERSQKWILPFSGMLRSVDWVLNEPTLCNIPEDGRIKVNRRESLRNRIPISPPKTSVGIFTLAITVCVWYKKLTEISVEAHRISFFSLFKKLLHVSACITNLCVTWWWLLIQAETGSNFLNK